MYYPDLSPYQHLKGSHEKALNVGWLDNQHPFLKGNVEGTILQRLGLLCKIRINAMRGYHVCDFCSVPPNANARSQWFHSTKIDVSGVPIYLGSAEI